MRTFCCLLIFANTLLSTMAAELSPGIIFVGAQSSPLEIKAAQWLAQDLKKKTGANWRRVSAWPEEGSGSIIALGTMDDFQSNPRMNAPLPGAARLSAEGYRVELDRRQERRIVWIIGHDPHGVLYGAGRLLREAELRPGRIRLPDGWRIDSSPKYPLRGHQLGYRPKTNSYDAWDLDQWEQYFRDLILFGCNAIELIPPRSDDAAWSPHFHRPPLEMMEGMSRLAKEYGLAVWIWFPAMEPNYADPAQVEKALREWAVVFQRLPRVDAVFVPGGDPGHTRPRILLDLLQKQAASLRRYHPRAQMWVSPQSFNQDWLDEFFDILAKEQPDWLSGVVYGPQIRLPIQEVRARVPRRYPIRNYPDITHSRQCQFPVADWDRAFAVTEARECINPRPRAEAAIFASTAPSSIGFITYSEGCNDDVNKAIWSALGWDPSADVTDILRQYARYFIGPDYADSFAQGLLALEQNWVGPAISNDRIDVTLEQFRDLERSTPPSVRRNWRFQQALFRAYYDAYVRRRLIRETDIENRALDLLREAKAIGSADAIAHARRILDEPLRRRVAPELRERIFALAEALFQSIGMQLSVDKYQAIAVDRGAMLDTLDFALNDRPWLEDQFRIIRQLPRESDRQRALLALADWTDPGPGGFYDDLGHPGAQPHLVRPRAFAADPGAYASPRSDYEEDLVVDEPAERPLLHRRASWIDFSETLFDGPLRMHYAHLDPRARYQLQVVYGGDTIRKKIRLAANGRFEIHPFMTRPRNFKRLTFDLPPEATRSGDLTLTWTCEPGLGGNGRGCQVSEVWLREIRR